MAIFTQTENPFETPPTPPGWARQSPLDGSLNFRSWTAPKKKTRLNHPQDRALRILGPRWSQGLTNEQRAYWNDRAAEYTRIMRDGSEGVHTGYTLFLSFNMNRVLAGLPIVNMPEPAELYNPYLLNFIGIERSTKKLLWKWYYTSYGLEANATRLAITMARPHYNQPGQALSHTHQLGSFAGPDPYSPTYEAAPTRETLIHYTFPATMIAWIFVRMTGGNSLLPPETFSEIYQGAITEVPFLD